MTITAYKCYNHNWIGHKWEDLGESPYVYKGTRYHIFKCSDCKAIAHSAPDKVNTLNQKKENEVSKSE